MASFAIVVAVLMGIYLPQQTDDETDPMNIISAKILLSEAYYLLGFYSLLFIVFCFIAFYIHKNLYKIYPKFYKQEKKKVFFKEYILLIII